MIDYAQRQEHLGRLAKEIGEAIEEWQGDHDPAARRHSWTVLALSLASWILAEIALPGDRLVGSCNEEGECVLVLDGQARTESGRYTPQRLQITVGETTRWAVCG